MRPLPEPLPVCRYWPKWSITLRRDVVRSPRPPMLYRSSAVASARRSRRGASGRPWPTGSRSAGHSSPSRGEFPESDPHFLVSDRGADPWIGTSAAMAILPAWSLAGDCPGPAGPAGGNRSAGPAWPRSAPSWPRWPWISGPRTWATWPRMARPPTTRWWPIRACSTNSWIHFRTEIEPPTDPASVER